MNVLTVISSSQLMSIHDAEFFYFLLLLEAVIFLGVLVRWIRGPKEARNYTQETAGSPYSGAETDLIAALVVVLIASWGLSEFFRQPLLFVRLPVVDLAFALAVPAVIVCLWGALTNGHYGFRKIAGRDPEAEHSVTL